MRALLVLLHRWFGLFVAGFLALSGLTGAVISWDHALDAWLNPALYHAATAGAPQPPLQLAQQLETADPRVQIRDRGQRLPTPAIRRGRGDEAQP